LQNPGLQNLDPKDKRFDNFPVKLCVSILGHLPAYISTFDRSSEYVRGDNLMLILLILLLLIFGAGGGYYGHSRWGAGGGAGVGLGTIVVIILIVYLLGGMSHF
jgi:hypothetical protein